MGLVDKVASNAQARTWPGDIPLEHLYTMGVAGERFFREIKEHGRFTGTRCPSCNLVYVPARLYCERCFKQANEWVPLPSTGTLASFTVLHRDRDGQPLAEPTAVGLVEIPGAHGGIVHRLGEVRIDELRIGLPVEAVFLAPDERTGSMRDVRYFRPRGA